MQTRIRTFFARYGLYASVVLLCLVFSGVLWTALMVQLNIERERIIESKRQENNNLAKVFEEHVARTIRAAEITLGEIAAEHRRAGSKFDIIQYAKDRSTYVDPYNILSFVDEKGDLVLANSPLPRVISMRHADTYQYHTQNNSPAIYIGLPRKGSSTGKWTVYLTRRVNKADGSFGGLWTVGMDPSYFSKIYAELDLGQDSIVTLIGRDGIIRSRSASGDQKIGQNVANSELFTKFLPASNHGSSIGTSPVDGITRINSYRALKDYPLVVFIGTSQASALAAHSQNRTRYLQAAGIANAVVLCLGLFALLQIRLSERANEERRRNDKRAEEAIQKLNVELEDRVEKRTSELTHSLEQLRQAQAHLVQTEKMAALGGLVAGVAHEINTPIGIGVTATSHLDLKLKALAERYQSGAISREDLTNFIATASESTAMVLANLQRAAELIRSFKQVAVDQTGGHRRHFYVKEYLQEVLRSLSPQLGRTLHQVNLSCPDELALYGNPGDFSQIVTNLVMNSLIHGFEGIEAGHIAIQISEQSEYLLLHYTDDGKGIAAEHLAHIFEPFYTTRRGQGGSGLGLHVIYNIITQGMGGGISCSSTPGHGVVFDIRIPRAAITRTDEEQPGTGNVASGGHG